MGSPVLFEDSVIPRMKGKDFEAIVKHRLDVEAESGHVAIERAGVKCAIREFREDGTVVAQIMKSRVDFDGLLPSGRAFDFDCKVCSGSSFPLSEYRSDIGTKAKVHQLEYLMRRARFKSVAGILIHWNSRETKTLFFEPDTFWFPVDERIRFWKAFYDMDVRTISRDDCEEFGVRVRWTKNPPKRSFRPDVLSVIKYLACDD